MRKLRLVACSAVAGLCDDVCEIVAAEEDDDEGAMNALA